MLLRIFIVALLVLGLAACSRKKEPPKTPVKMEVAPPVPQKPPEPKAGQAFQEAEMQRRYEAAFAEFLALFEKPAPGSARWIRLVDGSVVGGKVSEADDGQVVLVMGDNQREVGASLMAEESRWKLFAQEFARHEALRRVRDGVKFGDGVAATNLPARFAMLDTTVARAGPGDSFRRVEGEHTVRGEQVGVLDEFEGWLRLEDRDGVQRWISKWLTYELDDSSDAGIRADVEGLVHSGLIAALDRAGNAADVDLAIWRGTDANIRMGIARTLAAFCASAENGQNFVTIRDRATQRKLGRYSASQGWKEATF
jgi:hypothetical protein